MDQPKIVYERAPCPKCGAVDEDQAAQRCRPSTDETGERFCIGEFDDHGNSIQPTEASLRALDDWIERNEPRGLSAGEPPCGEAVNSPAALRAQEE